MSGGNVDQTCPGANTGEAMGLALALALDGVVCVYHSIIDPWGISRSLSWKWGH